MHHLPKKSTFVGK